MVLVFNLSASPSSVFLGPHLGMSDATAWDMLRKIRGHLSLICAQGAKSLKGKTVCVENLKFGNVMSRNGRRTPGINILIVATETNAFAFVVQPSVPKLYRETLDRLGVNPELYTFDWDFYELKPRMRHYAVHLLDREIETYPAEVQGAFRNGRSLAVYLVRSLHKWPVKVKNTHLQSYISEFVFRFNFAQDKAMMFPLFLSSLAKIEYCDESVAEAKTRHLNRAIR